MPRMCSCEVRIVMVVDRDARTGRCTADMNWFAVLAHHAARTPDKAITVFEGETTTYGEMAERATALAGGLSERGRRSWRRRGSPLVQPSRIPRDGLRRQLPRRDRHADQLAACRARGALHPRALRSSRARVRRIARSIWPNEATRASKPRWSVRAFRRAVEKGWTTLADLRAIPNEGSSACRLTADDIHRLMYTSGTTGRPKGVMITHANLAWKNLAHIDRVRLHELGSRARLRAPVPRRRPRPHDYLPDRRRCDDDRSIVRSRHPTSSTSSSDRG